MDWRAFAKALAPAAGTLIAVGTQWAVTGEFDRAELVTAVTGLSAAAITYLVPNTPATAPRRRRRHPRS